MVPSSSGEHIVAAPPEFFLQCTNCGSPWFIGQMSWPIGSPVPGAVANVHCNSCMQPMSGEELQANVELGKGRWADLRERLEGIIGDPVKAANALDAMLDVVF